MFNPNHLHYPTSRARELQRRAEMHRVANIATRRDASDRPMSQRMLRAVGRQMILSGRYLLAKSSSDAEPAGLEHFGGLAS